jgi:predicted transcriptional regulator
LVTTNPLNLIRKLEAIDISPAGSYPQTMDIHLSPERQAQLNDYAQRRGQDPAVALDEVLASALEWECREYDEAAAGIRQGLDDVDAGRTMPAKEALEKLRVEHGLPR